MKTLTACCLLLLHLSLPAVARADLASAIQAMEDPSHPLILMRTSRGDIYVELFPESAPRNVANFIALAQGEVPLFDVSTQQDVMPNYYDYRTFYRILRNTLVQAGAPRSPEDAHPEYTVVDEINARDLGLNEMKVLDETGALNPVLNLANRDAFEEAILIPLYRKMGIETAEALESRQFEVHKALREMTLRQAYENQGYSYNDRLTARAPVRGSLAMAGSAPNTNQAEFFFLLQDAPWISGKSTIIGEVVEGMEIVDRIDQGAVLRGDSTEPTPTTATMIFDVRHVNAPPSP
ncbi:MAG: peptidylprolyl isomerase [Pseudomonadales bacterium]|nr:peptidylprolyl isomerase [Pseudomonadales bacterium]